MTGERSFINLNRRGAEIKWRLDNSPLRQFSSVDWRQGQYTAVNQQAYRHTQRSSRHSPT
ncbi:MAG: hypothetical protein H6662_02850 [Ardenticatenaceae bacterium]|nr:hypothetical protein [Ardenticatenaceae bacterium]